MKKLKYNATIIFIMSILFLGCNLQSINEGIKKYSEQMNYSKQVANTPQVISLSIDNPELQFLKNTKPVQKKHNVTIAMEPDIAPVEKWNRIEMKSLSPLIINNQSKFEEKHVPFLKRGSDKIFLKMKISNNSDRVIRPGGTIITFDIDGQKNSVSSENYQDFLSMLLVPNSSKEIRIAGPRVADLKEKNGIIRIGIYELSVGNKLANFEWYFSYEMKTVSDNGEVKIQRVSLTREEATKRHNRVYKSM